MREGRFSKFRMWLSPIDLGLSGFQELSRVLGIKVCNERAVVS